MINIRSVYHVVLRVSDLEKVGRFYIDVLGGAWDRRRPDLGLHHLRLGNVMIDLVPGRRSRSCSSPSMTT